MNKRSGPRGAGGLAAMAPAKSRLDAWVDRLEGLLGVPGGTLRRDLPGRAPGLFDGAREVAQARALAEARRFDRAGATAALRSAATGGDPSSSTKPSRQPD